MMATHVHAYDPTFIVDSEEGWWQSTDECLVAGFPLLLFEVLLSTIQC
jgi:hypothetical protein